jgi:hypothetical protein
MMMMMMMMMMIKDGSRGKESDLHFGGAMFKFQSRHRVTSLRFLVVFLSPSNQMSR